jgi:hypothetical protein
MSQDDKFILILDKMTEISERTAKIEQRCNSIEDSVKEIKEEDKEQNRLLAEHILGTTTNKERLEIEIQNRQQLEHRIRKLEKIPNFLSTLKMIVVYSAAIIGGIGGIYESLKALRIIQ